MDSDLAWINGKRGRQSWRYADAFQCSIISWAIYHFFIALLTLTSRMNTEHTAVCIASWYACRRWTEAIRSTFSEKTSMDPEVKDRLSWYCKWSVICSWPCYQFWSYWGWSVLMFFLFFLMIVYKYLDLLAVSSYDFISTQLNSMCLMSGTLLYCTLCSEKKTPTHIFFHSYMSDV